MREPIISQDSPLADVLNAFFLRRVWREPVPAAADEQSPETEDQPADAEPEGTCDECGNYANGRYCSICTNPLRSGRTLMVVRSPQDIKDEETSGAFTGLYHVQPPLGGVEARRASSDSLGKLRERINRFGTDSVLVLLGDSPEDSQHEGVLRQTLRFEGLSIVRLPYKPGGSFAAFLASEQPEDLGVAWMRALIQEAQAEQRTGPDDDPPAGGWRTAK